MALSSTALAKQMGLSARWGTSCGHPFVLKSFVKMYTVGDKNHI